MAVYKLNTHEDEHAEQNNFCKFGIHDLQLPQLAEDQKANTSL